MVQRNRILKKYVMRVTYFNENILCEMGEMILDGNKVRNEGDDRGNKVRDRMIGFAKEEKNDEG